MLFRAGATSPTPPQSLWQYDNLLALDLKYREEAQLLVQSRLPNYSKDHCVKLFGGSPYEFLSRCVLDENKALIGVMAFCVGKLDTVEIVAFVAKTDGVGIGRYMMESFIGEMKAKKKSSILTYIEPSAFEFFSKFDFTKSVPARSLYEKITSKYVAAIFMYRNLLDVIAPEQRPRTVREGDRLLITVDGTLIPRQAVVKSIDEKNGLALVHYYFWNPRHDEWIYTHSPRIRYDLPLPPEPPKNKGENQVTISEAKTIVESERDKIKKTMNLEECGYWPKGIKKKAEVQVLIEGEWIHAKVINKNDMYCYCEFEYNGSKWNQDFPRESIRLPDIGKTVVELCIDKKVAPKKRKREATSEGGKISVGSQVKKVQRSSKKLNTNPIELSPVKPSGTPSDRLARKQKRQGLQLGHIPISDSVDMFGKSPETADTSPSPTRSEYTCSVCKDDHGFVLHCALCNVAVHPACYLIDKRKFFPPKEWFCDTCVEQRLSSRRREKLEPTCVCCGQDRIKGGAMVQTVGYKYIHIRCGLMLGLDFHPIERRFSRVVGESPKSPLKTVGDPCSVCEMKSGPQVYCSDDSCSNHAHFGCIQNWNVSVKVNFNGERNVKIFCSSHNENAK